MKKRFFLSLIIIASLANSEMIHYGDKKVVLDTKTKLMWQDDADVNTVWRNWEDGINYCNNLSLSGFKDWRLPNQETLLALYPERKFLINSGDYYFSSSIDYMSSIDNAKVVNFENGNEGIGSISTNAYIRCVRDSNLTFNTLTSFLEAISTATIDKDKVTLHSSPQRSKLFLVRHNNKNYFGTKKTIFTQLGLFKAPYLEIQKRTQENLSDYLTIPIIPTQILPDKLKLAKDEFESNEEFTARVQKASKENEVYIQSLQAKYHSDVEARNIELEKRKANIEEKKREFFFQNFGFVMGEPKLSNATYNAEISTMFVDVYMSNSEWSKKVAIVIMDRNQAKAFKNSLSEVIVNVSFGYENNAFVLKSIDVDFASQKYIATLSAADYNTERVVVTIENRISIPQQQVEFINGDDIQNGNNAIKKKDYKTAFKLFKKVCDSGAAYGCYSLGTLYYDGNVVKKDKLKSLELFNKACDTGEARGCTFLGKLYYDGDGVIQSDEQALKYSIKACDMKDETGCKNSIVNYSPHPVHWIPHDLFILKLDVYTL